jgi:hypothetical protein
MDRLKIFISSTYRDLGDYRKRIIDQILQMKQIPVAMEFFGSQPEDASSICFKEIDECDVFVGIYGFYYGYTPVEEGESITEQEYIYARDAGKRRLCYFAHDTLQAELREKTTDEPEIKQRRLNLFKNRINKELVRSVFHSADDLSARLAADLSLLLQGEALGLVKEDVARKWLTWEIDDKLRVCAEEFNGGNMPFDYDSPLHWYWYKFAASRGWHETLSDLASTVISYHGPLKTRAPFLSLTRELKKMDWSANYYNIFIKAKTSLLPEIDELVSLIETHLKPDDIKDTVHTLFNFRETLQKLKTKLENPSYSKCFLVVGSTGSGKTHFIASIMGERETRKKGQNYLILKISFPFHNETLEELILKEIEKSSAVSWKSLKAVDSFLKKTYDGEDLQQLALLKTIFGEKSTTSFGPTKLVVAIDDLHEWLSRKPGFLKELTQFIAAHTQLSSLYWLLTINYNCYHYLSRNNEDMFLTYSWIDTRETYEDASVGLTHHIAGWFVLDEFNMMKGVGLQILHRELEVENREVSLALDYINHEEAIIRKISPPFMAWTLLELKDELPLTELVNLNYIEFVEGLWSKRTAGFSKGDETLLKQCCIFIAQYFIETWNFSPGLLHVKDKISGYAEGISKLREGKELDSALAKLQEENLLTTFTAEENSFPVEKLVLKQETFWEWHIAGRLLASRNILEQQINQTRLELETWFARSEQDDLKEDIFEFLLLMLEQHLKKDDADLRFSAEFWNLGLDSQHLPASAVWFAAAKAPVYIQRRLIGWINSSKYLPATKRELFAYMHFLAGASPEAIDVHSRLKLLQQNMVQIKENDFIYYYFFITRKMIAAISDNQVLVSCMLLLRGCESLGIADQLAAMAVYQLFHNLWSIGDHEQKNRDSLYKSVFAAIKEYLSKENKFAPYDYNKIKKEHRPEKWQRYFFREWVLYEFTHHLVNKRGPDMFFLLKRWKWFNPEYFGFRHQLVLEMEREATIAMGWAYRTGCQYMVPGKTSMKELIKGLLKSKTVRERKLAFHLIRHAAGVEGDASVIVNPELRFFLMRIYKDPGMKRIVNCFPNFFKANLGKL